MSVKETIETDAMCCPGCATNVVNAVREIDGVEEADADHGADEVSVVFDDGAVSVDDIEQTIERAGCGMG